MHPSRFIDGFRTPLRGYRYLRKHPLLWRYTVLPIVLNLLITVLVFALLIAVVVWFVGSVHPWLYEQLVDWGSWVAWSASILLGCLLMIVCLGVSVLSYQFLSGVLCGYFYGILAEKVEYELGIGDEQIKSISFGYQILDTVYRMSVLLTAQLFFFVFSFFPVVGGPIALIGNLAITWVVNGMDYLDAPLAMRGWRYIDKRRFGMRHWEETLGLGAVVFCFGFVPLVGAVLMTTAIVGAVQLHRDLETRDRQASDNSASDANTLRDPRVSSEDLDKQAS